MTTNIQTCAITGRKITAGDQIVRTSGGHIYAVKANIRLTADLRLMIEADFNPPLPAVVIPQDEIEVFEDDSTGL